MTLAEWLSKRFPTASRTTLRRMVAERRVVVGGRPATRFDQPVGGGDGIEVRDRPAVVAARHAGARESVERAKAVRRDAHDAGATSRGGFTVIHEDADLIVVAKPAGLLTSTVPREPRPTLWTLLREDVATRDPRAKVGLVHRLDRDASGLLVFSKNDAAYDSLKTQFFHHAVERVYHAVVRGHPKPPAGRIESRLVERADGVVYSTKQSGRGDRAVTDYAVVRAVKRLSLVRVTLQTGRKHQIRVHMSQRNWSIVGDPMYGHGEKSPPDTGLMLTATRLGFTHPRTGEAVAFEIPIPPAMEALVPQPASSPGPPFRG